MGKSGFEGFNILVQDSIPLKEEDFTANPNGVREVTPDSIKGEIVIPGKKTIVDTTVEVDTDTDVVDTIDTDITPAKTDKKDISADKKTDKKEDKAPKKADINPFEAFGELLGEKGIISFDPETFDATEEGLTKAVEQEIESGITSYKESLGTESQKFIEYLERGGDPANYLQKKASFSYLKTSEDQLKADENLQKNVIKDLLTRDGYDFEEIKEKLKDYEESGLLERESLRALKKVKAQDQAADSNLVENQRQEETRRQDAYKNYLKTLDDMIQKKTEIAGFQLPDKSKKPFYDYITRPVTEVNGQPATQMQADIASDTEGQLKMAFFYFNKFDFTKFKKQADSKAASGLREALGRYSDQREKTSRQAGSSEEKPDFNIFKKNLNI